MDRLNALREQIKAIEWSEQKSADIFSFGVPQIDQTLPLGGLLCGAVHEWTGPHQSAVYGVCAALLGSIARKRGPILWCTHKVDFDPQGLSQSFGLWPEHVIFVESNDSKEVLWALEEGLQSPKLGAVFGDVASLSLAQCRRLQLGAQKSGVPAFIYLPPQAKTSPVATSRWRISSKVSSKASGLWREDGVGTPQFVVELLRCRGGSAPHFWELKWDEQTLSFHMLSKPNQERRHAWSAQKAVSSL